MEKSAPAHDAAMPASKHPHAQQKHCVGCGKTRQDCDCRGCNCATCATKQASAQGELESGGCHHKKKDCACTQRQPRPGVLPTKAAASSTTTQTANQAP